MIRFLIDECLSPFLALTAKQQGYEGVHVRQLGLDGAPDELVASQALAREDIVVTNNARDFRRLYATFTSHPGLVIVLPSLKVDIQVSRFIETIAFIESQPTVVDQMVIVHRDGTITIEPWPPISAQRSPTP